MRFEKPPLTIEQQVELLLSRGMIGDAACIAHRLAMANYYRLSGYWHPFRTAENTFRPRTGFELSICKHCLDRIAPQSQWPDRLDQLLARYPEIPIAEMGFPENWQESPIWKKKEGGLGYGG